MISLRDISVEYTRESKTIRAVDRVSLDIAPGSIQGIVGFSGAGKSTLLRTINLLERPTSGTVLVNNQNLSDLTA